MLHLRGSGTSPLPHPATENLERHAVNLSHTPRRTEVVADFKHDAQVRLLDFRNHLPPNPAVLSLSKDYFSFRPLCAGLEEKDSPSTGSGQTEFGSDFEQLALGLPYRWLTVPAVAYSGGRVGVGLGSKLVRACFSFTQTEERS